MTTEAAFLQEIQQHPEDDAPRLVYADWLEEHDDPRGRYLRVEVELSHLDDRDPRYGPLEEELQALRAEIEPEWLAQAGLRYDLVLRSYRPEHKIFVIKGLRDLTDCGLKEAKDLSERPSPVTVQTGLTRQDAERGRELLSYWRGERMAEIEVRPTGRARPSGQVRQGPCDLLLHSCAPVHKIALIKRIRELTGLGLKETKDLVDSPTPIKLLSGVTPEEAERWRAALQELAQVEVRGPQLTATPAPAGGKFDLFLRSYPASQKIEVIKAIRELTGLCLAEAKDRSEAALPVVIACGLTSEQAQQAQARFQGRAELELRPAQTR